MARPEVTGKHPPLQPLAFSVEEFKAHGISIGFFYTLLKDKRGPEIMKLGTRTLISAERTAASSNNNAA